MRHGSPLVLGALLGLAAACGGEKSYPLVGQVVAVDAARQELTVKHEDIRGFMPGMTMPFKVKDAAQVASSKPGDLITARLIVEETTGYLADIKKTGEAPLPAGAAPPRLSLLEPGAEVPDAEFVDQDGRARRLSEWRGKTRAVTFVYTRCPLPDFCPAMDRRFAAVQKALKAEGALAERVHLMSVSFDPEYDTPEVLKKHAARVGASPGTWSYLTGPREAIDRFAANFGVTIMREDGKLEEIIHNLRTAIIDREGRLVKVLHGSEPQPAQLVEEIRAADARR